MAISRWKEPLRQKLIQVQSVRTEAGWDGYDATPISRDTVSAATIFLVSLPDSIHVPEIVPDPAGEIAFVWKSLHADFLVSVSPETLIFAGILESNKIHGELKFSEKIPSHIEKPLLDYFSHEPN